MSSMLTKLMFLLEKVATLPGGASAGFSFDPTNNNAKQVICGIYGIL